MKFLRHFISIVLLSAAPAVFAEQLIFAIDIIRHGDRTPLVALPAVDYQWPVGLGQLTAKGMRQEYNMGTSFRQKYIEQFHLLPEHYEQGTMYVRSTDFERTLMSAQSLLTGLYPPGTGPSTDEDSLPALPNAIQPIPIFSAPAQHDEMIVQEVSPKERTKLLQQYVYSTKEWQQKDKELQNHYPLWSQALGVQINSLADLELWGDSLYIHRLHHAPIPSSLTPEEVERIINTSAWAFMAQERPRQIARVYHSKLMHHIASFLNNGALQKSKLKYVLLSAHDTTIAGVLSYLGAPLETPPPYAANLNFALYDNGANYYTVKVTYNGQPVTIPECGSETCELQKFIQLINY